MEPARPMEAQTEQRLRRYASRVTWLVILVCNAVLVAGIWGSGVNLERLVRIPERFNPVQDICLRLSWHKVVGEQERVRLCSEWIQLSDPSGETHRFQTETQVVKGADGKLYFDHGAMVDYRLFGYMAFVAAVVALGLRLKRHLVARYRVRLATVTSNQE